MTIPKRLLALFLAVSIFSAQTAQAYSSLSWQPRTYHKVQRNKQSTETNIDGATQSQSRSHLSSSNGNVRLMSGNNTLIVGSDLAATQGKLAVAAGGGIGIFAGQDTLKQYTETQHTQDTDVFSKQKRVITDTLISSRYQGSTLAGNSIALDAGANLVLQAAQLNSKGDTNIAAGGDLKLLSATDSTYRKHTETLQTDGIAINDLSNGFDDRRKNSSVTSKIDINQVTRINSDGNFGFVLNRIEAQKRLSMTYDQGKEMAGHQQLAADTGIKVYFADPHSPWQRGINENTNGLARQYLPKGSDLSLFSQKELDAIAWKLNTRPRKSLGFKCPAQLFTPDAFDFRQHHAALFALGA